MNECSKLPQNTAEISTAERVERILVAVESRISEETNKATVADFIRLIQLRKEYEAEVPWHIEAKWVEPKTEEESGAT